jgi:hypothetical protein
LRNSSHFAGSGEIAYGLTSPEDDHVVVVEQTRRSVGTSVSDGTPWCSLRPARRRREQHALHLDVLVGALEHFLRKR